MTYPPLIFRAYAAIVFITNNRFETGKKKLSYLSFEDFAACANYMISNWSYSSEGMQFVVLTDSNLGLVKI